MTPISIVGYVGSALVVVAWLVVSFTSPSPKRAALEWLGACGLYLALVALFTNLSLRAQESGSTAALVAFGFLLALFGSGLVVSLVQTALAFRGPSGRASADATH
ncbi:MAG TPA: hypothetical protein VKH41_09720 [Myxococcota bacterium]|nr:hypothetical protein [Myxococcota bacterium]